MSWIIDRGYTMHEHLDQFGIINMNGRVYDPLTAMFFSPDPFVQAPGNWLNYNRYGYVMNNPLKYTDPNGEFWNIAIGAFIGGIVNWVSNGAEFTWEGLGYFGIGAAVGALSAVGGAWMATTFKAAGVFAGALVGATTGAITGGASSIMLNGGNNVLNGGQFFDNWQSNLKSGIINGAIGGAISGGIKGWKYAKSQGANPWTGEVNGSERSYEATIKTGVSPQEDPSKHCYSVTDEYADKGHSNLSRSQFQDAAAKLNDGVIPDGADPGIVARKAGLNAGVAPMKGIQVDQLGQGMQKGSIEVIAVIGSDPTAGHTVNVVSFKVADRLNMFGGGNTPFLKTSTMQVWNPISATVHRLSQSILKLEFIVTIRSTTSCPPDSLPLSLRQKSYVKKQTQSRRLVFAD
jgi:RHS repeat-associated protein